MNTSTLAVQDDGKIVIGGTKIDSQIISRYNSNGTVDSSFGLNGISAVVKNSSVGPSRICILPNGKILVLSSEEDPSRYYFYKYLSNGNLDIEFGDAGKKIVDLPTRGVLIGLMELQTTGHILLAGQTNETAGSWPGFYMARCDVEGNIDRSFGEAGEVKTYFNFIKSEPLNSDFYDGGTGITDLALQPNGKIIACGTLRAGWNGYIISDSMALVRYNADGSLDKTFGKAGKFSFDVPNVENPYRGGTSANSITLLPNGKLLVGGGVYSQQTHGYWQKAGYIVLRLWPNGTLDDSFGEEGIRLFPAEAHTECLKIFALADEKVLLFGNGSALGPFAASHNPEMLVAGVTKNGDIDESFAAGGLWQPAFYNNEQQKLICRAYTVLMKGQRIYVFGDLPDSYNKEPWGSTIFVFKIDGVASNPKIKTICGAGSATRITSDVTGKMYQWQVSTDSLNFSSLSDDVHYHDVNSSSLSIKEIPLNWNGYRYRCITETNISNAITLRFLNTNENEWRGETDNAWENPANWLCGTVPGTNSIVYIPSGNVKITSNVTVKELHLQPGASVVVAPGYTVEVK